MRKHEFFPFCLTFCFAVSKLHAAARVLQVPGWVFFTHGHIIRSTVRRVQNVAVGCFHTGEHIFVLLFVSSTHDRKCRHQVRKFRCISTALWANFTGMRRILEPEMQQPPVLFVFSKYHSTTHAAYLIFINTLMCIQWRLARAEGSYLARPSTKSPRSGNVRFVI